MTLRFKKDQLIEALESKRKHCQKLDKEAAAKHKKEEADALKRYRDQLRLALKLTYDDIKATPSCYPTVAKGGCRVEFDRPGCPVLWTSKLDRALASVRTSQQTRYTIDSKGSNGNLHALLMIDAAVLQTPC